LFTSQLSIPKGSLTAMYTNVKFIMIRVSQPNPTNRIASVGAEEPNYGAYLIEDEKVKREKRKVSPNYFPFFLLFYSFF
jgi:hypothetical protein